MRRFPIWIGVAAAALLLLAWVWPEGTDPAARTETSASDDMAADDDAERSPSAEPTESPSPSPSPSPSAQADIKPAADAYAGPLGTRNNTGADALALTFDDGPDPNWTPKVLDALRERGIKATFCVIGAYAEANPDLIADIAHDGHSLCNHAWFHEFDLGSQSEAAIHANLKRTNEAIEKAAPGATVEYYRQPGGQWTERVIGVAADLGMESLHWTVDPSDWDKAVGEGSIRDHVIDRSGPGAIVLLHDGAANQQAMLPALDSILDEYERRGYIMGAL